MSQNPTQGDEDERVSLRRLSSLPPAAENGLAASAVTEGFAGFLRSREGSRLTVELDPAIAAQAVAAGDLVEIRASQVIYLGQVRALRGLQLTIVLEHAIDVASLEAIQRIWNRAPGPEPDSLTSGLLLRTIEQVPE